MHRVSVLAFAAALTLGCGRYRFEIGQNSDAGPCGGIDCGAGRVCLVVDQGAACGCALGFQEVAGLCLPQAPPNDCAELVATVPNAPSGSYTIDPGGAGAVVTQCDISTDGGAWTLVYDQDWASFGAVRARADWDLVNPDGSVEGDYSILARLRDFGYSSYEFRYSFPFGPLPAGFVQWTQDANPYDVGDGRGRANVTRLTSSVSPAPAGCRPFVGLGLSAGSTTRARLDADDGGCWWFAVGVAGTHPSPTPGIPAYFSPQEQTARRIQLWVRASAPP